MGESAEVLALRRYMVASGVPHRVTSTCRPGTGSRHNADGTRGCGLAVDFAGAAPFPAGAVDRMAVAQALLRVESQLFELIYSPLGFSIKQGRRVPSIAYSDHFNHVHVAVDRGVDVRWEAVMPDLIVADAPVVNLVPTPTGAGYWIICRNGAIFAFGDAVYHGRVHYQGA